MYGSAYKEDYCYMLTLEMNGVQLDRSKCMADCNISSFCTIKSMISCFEIDNI